VLSHSVTRAQDNTIGQFVFWKPKEGLEQKFETGYKQHLQWHKANNDPWGWYGWYVISGPRSGQFVDATVGHRWGDFDNAIRPSEDAADNRLHVYPFGALQIVFKVSQVKALSTDVQGLKSKFTRMIMLSVNDVPAALKIVEKLKGRYEGLSIQHFQTYRIVDGGEMNQIMILLGFEGYHAYGKSAGLQEDLAAIERSLKVKVITSITSETLVYREDMSLFPE
jgi:hypothetical protein